MGEIVRNQFLDFFLVYPKRHYYDKERESIFFRTDSTCFDGAEWSGWSYKAKDFFFLENYRVNILGFQLVLKLKIDNNLSLQYLWNKPNSVPDIRVKFLSRNFDTNWFTNQFFGPISSIQDLNFKPKCIIKMSTVLSIMLFRYRFTIFSIGESVWCHHKLIS